MDAAFVKAKLIEVIETIQRDSGYNHVPITGLTIPASDLPGFDSKIWPTAIGQLSKAIGITIPSNKNIFVAFNGRQRLSIDQIVGGVCKLAERAA
jgi:hypothetical protein